MKPLSPLKYFFENKKSAAVIAIILLLSVAVVSFITSIVTSIIVDATNANLKVFEKFSVVYKTSDELFMKDTIIEEIEAYPETKKTITVFSNNTSFMALMGGTSVPVYFIEQTEELEYVFDLMDLTLTKGRFPEEDKFEVILHENLLKNKNLKVGDYIGSDAQEEEWLPGKYLIAGSLVGEGLIGFGTISFLTQTYKDAGLPVDKPMGVMVIPKDGQLQQLNDRLDQIDRNEASVATYSSLKRNIDLQIESMNVLLTVIIIVVASILAISVGALVFIIYMGRVDEFGILYAMGYTKGFIKKLIIKELAVLITICWGLGYLLSYLMTLLINLSVLSSRGQALYFFTTTGLINTLFIPIMVFICTAYPIMRKLKKWDPIAVIERRDL